jgi:hypothetical protein
MGAASYQEIAKPPGETTNDRPAAGEMREYGGCGHDWQGISSVWKYPAAGGILSA